VFTLDQIAAPTAAGPSYADLLAFLPVVGTAAGVAKLVAPQLSAAQGYHAPPPQPADLTPSPSPTLGPRTMPDLLTKLAFDSRNRYAYALVGNRKYAIPDEDTAIANFGPDWASSDRQDYSMTAAQLDAYVLRPWGEFLTGGVASPSISIAPSAFAAAGGFTSNGPSLTAIASVPVGMTPSGGPGAHPFTVAGITIQRDKLPLILIGALLAWYLVK
jgi:hypothetical protein